MKKVAVGCQGGGMHAAFEVGVLTEILEDVKAGKLRTCGLERDIGGRPECADGLVWACSKKRGPGSLADAIS